jgi:hypothetical protein
MTADERKDKVTASIRSLRDAQKCIDNAVASVKGLPNVEPIPAAMLRAASMLEDQIDSLCQYEATREDRHGVGTLKDVLVDRPCRIETDARGKPTALVLPPSWMREDQR